MCKVLTESGYWGIDSCRSCFMAQAKDRYAREASKAQQKIVIHGQNACKSSLRAEPHRRAAHGNIRPAVFNWLFARREGGTFLLRFDDTDLERSKEEYVAGIRDDLNWLGLTWDEEFRQSQRFAFYEEAAEKLKKAGRLYACYEAADELERRRKRQMARGKPPVYDRAALKLRPRRRRNSRPKAASRTGAFCWSSAARPGTI